MGLSTQIGGDNQAKIAALRDTLIQNGISVTHPSGDEFVVLERDAWSKYESELALFESIATNSFHIIFNTHGELTDDMAQQVLYAMLYEKPILCMQEPSLHHSTSTFARDSFKDNRDKMFVSNLLALDKDQLELELRTLPSVVEYDLSDSDISMANICGKTYFRKLLASCAAGTTDTVAAKHVAA